MSKIYKCIKLIDDKICGESNIDNFKQGRYTICKKCINQDLKEYREKQKKLKNIEKRKDIDPTDNLSWLIKNIIKTEPIVDSKNILEAIDEVSKNINECSEGDTWRRNIINSHFDKLFTENKYLIDTVRELSNRITILENKIKNK